MRFISFHECKNYICSDAYRYYGNSGLVTFWKLYIFTIGFRYTVWMRLCTYFMTRKWALPLYAWSIFRVKHLSYKSGIQISWKTQIGKGFYIGHFGTIVVSPMAVIGNNVNISQGCCVGAANRGPRKGSATIGNCVYLGPGSKVVGAVKIGNNVCVGANAVVTSDIPDEACVGGVPAKIISMDGIDSYIEKTV